MAQMNLSTKEKQTHRHGGRAYGCPGGEGWGKEVLGVWDQQMQTIVLVLVVKNPPAKAGDIDLIPGSGRYSGEGHGNPLQYSCPENSLGRGAQQATQSMWVCAKSLQSCPTLRDTMNQRQPGSSVPGIRILTGVGCHALHQGIFPIQGSNRCLVCLLH